VQLSPHILFVQFTSIPHSLTYSILFNSLNAALTFPITEKTIDGHFA
jgi:hypothetical protein